LAGLLSRMERDGHIIVEADTRDRRSRIVRMTKSGQHVWHVSAQPKIRTYYEQLLADFSISDTTHALHYLLKLLENMKRVDGKQLNGEDDDSVE
jgi:DNA-binding MarR family transcriptional regulator